MASFLEEAVFGKTTRALACGATREELTEGTLAGVGMREDQNVCREDDLVAEFERLHEIEQDMLSYIAVAAYPKIFESLCLCVLEGKRPADAGALTYDRPKRTRRLGIKSDRVSSKRREIHSIPSRR